MPGITQKRNPIVVGEPVSGMLPLEDERLAARQVVQQAADDSEGVESGLIPQPRHRKPVRRAVSTFNMMVLLACAAIGIVLYISNIIAVDRLLNNLHQLQSSYQMLMSEQDLLVAQFNRMASLERIRRIAEDQLSLRSPSQPPVWFSEDPDKSARIDEAVRAAQSRRSKERK